MAKVKGVKPLNCLVIHPLALIDGLDLKTLDHSFVVCVESPI